MIIYKIGWHFYKVKFYLIMEVCIEELSIITSSTIPKKSNNM